MPKGRDFTAHLVNACENTSIEGYLNDACEEVLGKSKYNPTFKIALNNAHFDLPATICIHYLCPAPNNQDMVRFAVDTVEELWNLWTTYCIIQHLDPDTITHFETE